MKLTDLLKESSFRGKIYTDKDKPPFKVNEYGYKTSELVGTKKSGWWGQIYQMKEEMKEGKFDPKNPTVHVHGFGVWELKGLEKSIARELKEAASKAIGNPEWVAVKLYMKHSVLESKIKAANDAYRQMDTPQYKRAVTMYKKKKR